MGTMKKSRYGDEQIVRILREADKVPIAEVAKRHSVSEQSITAGANVSATWAVTMSSSSRPWRRRMRS